jgi:hypothetical protein
LKAPVSNAGEIWLFWEAGTWSPAIDVFTNENVRKPMLGMGVADETKLAGAEERFRPLADLLNDRFWPDAGSCSAMT